jgi:hypothetical protein
VVMSTPAGTLRSPLSAHSRVDATAVENAGLNPRRLSKAAPVRYC